MNIYAVQIFYAAVFKYGFRIIALCIFSHLPLSTETDLREDLRYKWNNIRMFV